MSAISAALPLAPKAAEEEVIALHDEFRNGLLRYVLSFGIDVHDGEDVIQEVFLSLFRHLQLGRSRANLRGWLFRVAHNLALKQRNRTQRRQAQIASSEDFFENRSDPAENPEEQLAKSQRQRQLLLVVGALSASDRYCLLLRAEGLRYREIADGLRISLGAGANSLARSMERLRRADER